MADRAARAVTPERAQPWRRLSGHRVRQAERRAEHGLPGAGRATVETRLTLACRTRRPLAEVAGAAGQLRPCRSLRPLHSMLRRPRVPGISARQGALSLSSNQATQKARRDDNGQPNPRPSPDPSGCRRGDLPTGGIWLPEAAPKTACARQTTARRQPSRGRRALRGRRFV